MDVPEGRRRPRGRSPEEPQRLGFHRRPADGWTSASGVQTRTRPQTLPPNPETLGRSPSAGPQSRWNAAEETKLAKSQVRREAWRAGGGAGGRRRGCAAHTIFLMLGRLKLPVLRCFWTWLAEPWRVRPPLDSAELGDNCTFSLSTPGGQRENCSTRNATSASLVPTPAYLGSAGRWPVRSWSWTGSGWQ